MTGSLIHVDESLYSPDSEPANGDTGNNDGIYEGSLITRESGGGAHVTDPSVDSRVDGIVPHLDRGDHIPEHDEDYSTSVYEGDGTWGNSDSVSFSQSEAGSVWYPWTPSDTSLTAPNITKNDLVVAIRVGNETVVVEDGYSDGNGNTYNETNSNAIVLGRADDSADGYDELVAIRVNEYPSR